ncbi:sugar-binding domain-containing protein [Pedobacter sp. L105]|uniref:sugar-binding domain-containing protein n=1 Tax=Pedobacter sp. L105 TaxID=1641871 RepID=UPI00131D840D|nr:sugar-binding domain-containing protein [Pedobacter sp. L105]
MAGQWDLALDTGMHGIKDNHPVVAYNDHVFLPGTLDENKKGFVNHNTTNTDRLSSAYLFEGWAWYQRQVIIPPSWKGRSTLLYLERTKPSKVWIDGVFVGASDNLMTSQQYQLPMLLTPGKHNINILIDNSNRAVPGAIQSSHAWTDNTQTNWNGIIGKVFLQSLNKIQVKDLQTYPNIKQKKVGVQISFYNSTSGLINSELKLSVASTTAGAGRFPGKVFKIALKPGANQLHFDYYLGNKMQLWSEFTPNVYSLKAELLKVASPEERTTRFGMRSFQTKGTQFSINNLTTFLRGNIDNCIFPLTGYPPMELAGWLREFRIAKSYGINHFRFHSWTPPEAAFEAADLEGIYMQVELPFWGNVDKKNTVLNTFLLKEGNHILKEFGNHPSFVMLSSGNELTGDTELMKVWLNNFKSKDNRHLYAFGSNIYIGEKGYIPGEDFTVTMQVGKNPDTAFTTPVRGSFSYADMRKGGAVNALYPSLHENYETAISKSPIPVIGHEIGQYQVYPNFDEISKYTGVLKPTNLEIFHKRLNMTGMGQLDKEFSRASGSLSVICYKADIEMSLRTKGFGGFQMLDLQDYPGQGTALIGILDAFMDSKGLITPEDFRKFNNAVVPLLVTRKYCWKNDEHLTAMIKVSNYGAALLKNQAVEWKLTDGREQIISQGKTHKDINQGELASINALDINLSILHTAQKLTLRIALPGTNYENTYSLWVYPAKVDVSVPNGVLVRSSLDSTSIKAIENGANVVLFPQKRDIIDRSVGGLFTPDFWNYEMFNGGANRDKEKLSPGTMGILTNPNHALFKYFPTDFHTDWQWWSIINSSNPLILDKTDKNYRPIVQVIDNINRNHKLGLIFEFALGKGKLLICMSDLRIIDKPEAKQLYSSLLAYVSSDQFHPGQKITADDLVALF